MPAAESGAAGGATPPREYDIGFDPGVAEEEPSCAPEKTGYCEPGYSVDCYEGPAGTEGVGSCAAGQRYCNRWGTAYGGCLNQMLPRPDDCTAPAAWTCDGEPATCGVVLRTDILSAPMTAHSGQRIASGAGGVLVRSWVSQQSDGSGQLVVEQDLEGTIVWSASFELSTFEDFDFVVSSLVIDASGSTIVGARFERSPFSSTKEPGSAVFKLDATGALVWAREYANPDVYVRALAVGSEGDIWVVGGFSGEFDFGAGVLDSSPGEGDGFLLRLDTDGVAIWSRALDSATSADLYAIAVDASNDAYVGGYEVSSRTTCGTSSVLVASFGPTGDLRWKRTFSSALSTGSASSIVLGPTGQVYVSGRINTDMANAMVFEGPPLDGTMFVAKLDETGEPVWSRSVNDIAHGPAHGGYLGLHPAGHLMWANQDAFSLHIRTYDQDAHLLWERFVPCAAKPWQYPDATVIPTWGLFGFAVQPDGRFAISGSFSEWIDFGAGPVASPSGWDGYVAVFEP